MSLFAGEPTVSSPQYATRRHRVHSFNPQPPLLRRTQQLLEIERIETLKHSVLEADGRFQLVLWEDRYRMDAPGMSPTGRHRQGF
jgi:hypothetical protein